MEPVRDGQRPMHVSTSRNSLFAILSALSLGPFLIGCGSSNAGSAGATGSGPKLAVTVLTGNEEAQELGRAGNSSPAWYLADSGKVAYVVSGPYSSTCSPQGNATQEGTTIILTVDVGEDDCTADAARDTFRIGHLATRPERLVIKQAGERDVHLALPS